jgi:hypothetical protein
MQHRLARGGVEVEADGLRCQEFPESHGRRTYPLAVEAVNK